MVPVVLLVVGVAFGVYVGLVRQSRLTLLSSKEAAADMVVKLTCASVMPAVVFGDDQEMQRTVGNLARNPDVSDAELWGFESSALGATEGLLAKFHRQAPLALGRPSSARSGHFRESDSIRVVEPVVNLEGKTVAALVVRFSTAREAATLAQLSRQIFYVSAATALCLAIAILLAIHRVVVRPVKRLEEAAGRLARGDQHALENDGRARARVEDEVVRLAEKFAEMADAVRDREARLGVRNAELKLILDSVEQGFLTVGIDGKLFAERSAVVERWVGALPDGAMLWDLVERIDRPAAQWLKIAWEQVTDAILPLDISLDQLPKRIAREEQQFSLAYHPVVDDRQQRVVIVLTDITAELARQRALAEQHEFAALVDQFVRDRRGFHSFWEEASTLVSNIVGNDPAQADSLRRNLHTLKGNTRFFGLTRVSALCHELESAMAERGERTLTERERLALADLWESLRQRIDPLMRGATVFLEVSRDEYERLLLAVQHREPAERIEQLVRDLRREPVAARFEHAKRVLGEAARKLGKSQPQVNIQHGDLRVPPGPWAPFWTIFAHILNNAVDHGLEEDAERLAAGKSVPGTITLAVAITQGEIVIDVRDDGRGIDWERVRRRAAERGLPSQSEADLKQALFSHGFSMREEVTEVSGRGVGLSAVQHVVTAMGGRIQLESTLGAGTSWQFRFPAATFTDSSERAPVPSKRQAGGAAVAT